MQEYNESHAANTSLLGSLANSLFGWKKAPNASVSLEPSNVVSVVPPEDLSVVDSMDPSIKAEFVAAFDSQIQQRYRSAKVPCDVAEHYLREATWDVEVSRAETPCFFAIGH